MNTPMRILWSLCLVSYMYMYMYITGHSPSDTYFPYWSCCGSGMMMMAWLPSPAHWMSGWRTGIHIPATLWVQPTSTVLRGVHSMGARQWGRNCLAMGVALCWHLGHTPFAKTLRVHLNKDHWHKGSNTNTHHSNIDKIPDTKSTVVQHQDWIYTHKREKLELGWKMSRYVRTYAYLGTDLAAITYLPTYDGEEDDQAPLENQKDEERQAITLQRGPFATQRPLRWHRTVALSSCGGVRRRRRRRGESKRRRRTEQRRVIGVCLLNEKTLSGIFECLFSDGVVKAPFRSGPLHHPPSLASQLQS